MKNAKKATLPTPERCNYFVHDATISYFSEWGILAALNHDQMHKGYYSGYVFHGRTQWPHNTAYITISGLWRTVKSQSIIFRSSNYSCTGMYNRYFREFIFRGESLHVARTIPCILTSTIPVPQAAKSWEEAFLEELYSTVVKLTWKATYKIEQW